MARIINSGIKIKIVNNEAIVVDEAFMPEVFLSPEDAELNSCWTAYHLDNDTCGITGDPHPETKNCRDNPYCLLYLGLERIQRLKSQHCDKELAILNKRDITKQPCGLVNSGNFCYVNSFLQIWFNDLVFRRCIYQWRPHPDFVQHDESKMDVQAVMNAMQKLFFTMQFSPFEAANAEELISLLRLDNEQHDVQEFNTLFFDALERNLMRHPNGAYTWEVIRKRFEAHISQLIHCDVCNSQRESSSLYCSLNISITDHNTLTDAINAFLSAERLIGYRCEQCGMKDTSSRSARFTDLPPVLIIQFNRFIFDENGHHKKLKTPIQYPRVLSDRVLKQNDAGESNYELSGVMIHRGPNTHCGHYYDLIKSPDSNEWFSYNDKTVTKVKQPGVNVEGEQIQCVSPDVTECYALIYRRMGSDDDVTLDTVGMPPKRVVRDLERAFEDEDMANNGCLSMWRRHISSRYTALMNLWNDLKVSDELKSHRSESRNQIAFLPSALLEEILSKEFKAIEIMPKLSPKEFLQLKCRNSDDSEDMDDDNFDHLFPLGKLASTKHSLCPHNKVPIASIFNGELKAVCREVAEVLLQQYKINVDVMSEKRGIRKSHRLMTAEDICAKCVNIRQQKAHIKQCLESDLMRTPVFKQILLRTYNPCTKRGPERAEPEGSMWASNSQLRNFKKVVCQQVERFKSSQQNTKQLVFYESTGYSRQNSPSKSQWDGEWDEPTPLYFNDDIYCLHGGLTFLEKRTWITPDEWEVLRKNLIYYRDPIPVSEKECCLCSDDWSNNLGRQKRIQREIDSIYCEIGDTVRRIERRPRQELRDNTNYNRVICSKFIKELIGKTRIEVNPVVPRLCQDCLLCEHNKPYLMPGNVSAGLPITEDEWETIAGTMAKFQSSPIVSIELSKSGDYEGLCEICRNKYLEDESRKPFIYPDGGYIYVKLNNDENATNKKVQIVSTTREEESARVYIFKMCSTDRIVDLKYKIYKRLNHTPNDQLLSHNGVALWDKMTFEEACIRPENSDAPLILTVKSESDDDRARIDAPPRQIERDFAGTALFG